MVFDFNWFVIHQEKLLWFANTKYGRDILCISNGHSEVGNRRIVEILPNCITWIADLTPEGEPIFQTEFRVHDKYAKRLFYAGKPIWDLFHTFDMKFANKFMPSMNLGFDSLTQYPGSIGANNPVDGFLQRAVGNESFNTIRTSAGNGTDVVSNPGSVCDLWADTNQYFSLRRGIQCFDTAALTSAAIISAAVLSFVFSSTTTNALANPNVHVASATLVSTSSLSTTDYLNTGSTSFGSVSWGFTMDNSTYTPITLDSNGRANVSLTGITKFSTKTQWDMLASDPGRGGSNTRSDVEAYMSDEAGTTKDPRLVVTYTLAVPARITGSRQAVNRASTY